MRARGIIQTIALGGVVALVSCAHPADPVPPSTEQAEFHMPLPEGAQVVLADEIRTTAPKTTGLLGSLAPDAEPPELAIPDIYARGRLIVGVEQSQNLLAYRNMGTGEVQGFEVDIAREIARDIFGNPNAVEFRFIDTNTWLPTLSSGQVDFVLNSISITRKRQDQAFFSTPYLRSASRLLVTDSSPYSSLEDLAGQRICVTQDSTGSQRIAASHPEQELLVVASSADCLLALQQNQAAAIMSDDAILSGMIAQDPFTRLVGERSAYENYGIAFAKPTRTQDTTGLIRQVNKTLARIFSDGTWQRLFQQWFGDYLSPQQPPPLQYRQNFALDSADTGRRQ